jgi:hypothetical protein
MTVTRTGFCLWLSELSLQFLQSLDLWCGLVHRCSASKKKGTLKQSVLIGGDIKCTHQLERLTLHLNIYTPNVSWDYHVLVLQPQDTSNLHIQFAIAQQAGRSLQAADFRIQPPALPAVNLYASSPALFVF